MKVKKDKNGILRNHTHESIKKVIAKPDEKRIKIIVTLKALVEIPERWIVKGTNVQITLNNEDDLFFIGLRKDNWCLTREIDFGLVDYLDTKEPTIQLVEDD